MRQITITFNKVDKLYLQLYEYIKDEILKQNIKQGEKIPSKRVLAANLNISLNTVITAYELLIDEGYIISKEKQGYFVSNNVFSKQDLNVKYNKEIKKEKEKIDFSTKNIDVTTFPFNNWKKSIKNVLLNDETALINKTVHNGDFELRYEISKHLYENRGMNVDPNQIFLGSSIEYLLELLIPILEIKNIGVENPGYKKMSLIFNNNNINVKPLYLDNEGIIISNNDNIDALYVTPSNQFPTGIKMSLARKNELINFSIKNNVYIIEDDFDSEFRIQNKPLQSIYSLSNRNVVFVSSFTRTISPALRISYMILPLNVSAIYNKRYISYSNTIPTFEQKVLADFIKNGFYIRHINKIKTIYRKKRELIISILEKYPYLFKIYYKNNYLSLIVDIIPKINFSEIKNEFINNRIDIAFLSDYYFNKESNNHLIIGYSGININNIEESIKKVIEIIKGHIS